MILPGVYYIEDGALQISAHVCCNHIDKQQSFDGFTPDCCTRGMGPLSGYGKYLDRSYRHWVLVPPCLPFFNKWHLLWFEIGLPKHLCSHIILKLVCRIFTVCQHIFALTHIKDPKLCFILSCHFLQLAHYLVYILKCEIGKIRFFDIQ